ncbi:MAG: helix-turn-helix domain-containing protein [Chloroflexi bacterium]|nr:MAG: helix-turn-helix domain-containing protein [Chloroflexota bacterium]
MLLTVKDLEGELQLGRTRTYELVRSGVIPVIRIGRAGSGWPDAGLVRPVCCAA